MKITFKIYQERSRKTWQDGKTPHGLTRAVLGLVGEAGEVAEKYKKFLRGDGNLDRAEMVKELGDVQYYLARLADYVKADLAEIAEANLIKLEDRKKRGVLKGSGDNR